MLDTRDIMQILLLQLQGSARNKWSRNILNIRREHKRKPDLKPDLKFIVSDPIFSKEAVEQYMDKKPNSRKTKVSSFPTQNDGKVHVEEKSLHLLQ